MTLLMALAGVTTSGLSKPGQEAVDQQVPAVAEADTPQQDGSGHEADSSQWIRTAYLGVSATAIDQVTARQLGLPIGSGLRIDRVSADSPAMHAGLKPGDVLSKFDDQLLINPEQLAVLVRTHKPGQSVVLHAMREGKTIELKATLAERELPSLGPGGAMRMPHQWMRDRMHQVPDHERIQGEDPFADMVEQMHRRHEHMRQMMDQMFHRLEAMRNDLGDMQGQQGFELQANFKDGEHAIMLKQTPDSRHLTVKTAEGKVLYDGEAPKDGQIKGLTPEVQKKVDDVLKNNRIELRIEPAPGAGQPEPIT